MIQPLILYKDILIPVIIPIFLLWFYHKQTYGIKLIKPEKIGAIIKYGATN